MCLAGTRGLEQLVQRFADPVHDQVEVRDSVVIGEQAEIDAAVVAHDRHRERLVGGQEGHRKKILQLAPEYVERKLGTGDVRHQQVEQPRGELQA